MVVIHIDKSYSSCSDLCVSQYWITVSCNCNICAKHEGDQILLYVRSGFSCCAVDDSKHCDHTVLVNTLHG